MPTGDKPDEAAKRAARISDLRALLDMLESEPSLPVPHVASSAYVQWVAGNEVSHVAKVFAAAEKLDTDVTYDQRDGRVETTWKRGVVTYEVFTLIPPSESDETRDTVTITSPSQILTTTATIARPDLSEPAAELPLTNGVQVPADDAEAGDLSC